MVEEDGRKRLEVHIHATIRDLLRSCSRAIAGGTGPLGWLVECRRIQCQKHAHSDDGDGEHRRPERERRNGDDTAPPVPRDRLGFP